MWTAMLFGDVMSPSIVVIAASIAPSIARTLASPVIEESKTGSITSVDASAGRERPSSAIAAIIEATICKFLDTKLWLRALPPPLLCDVNRQRFRLQNRRVKIITIFAIRLFRKTGCRRVPRSVNSEAFILWPVLLVTRRWDTGHLGRVRSVLAVLVMLLLTEAVYLRPETLRGTHSLMGSDYEMLHRWRLAFARQALAAGNGLPAWNRHEVLGTPFAANLQSFPWIPTRLVLLLFDPSVAYTVGIAMAVALAGGSYAMSGRSGGFGALLCLRSGGGAPTGSGVCGGIGVAVCAVAAALACGGRDGA